METKDKEVLLDELKTKLSHTIDENGAELHQLSKKIWENPELGFKEFKAHTFLTDFLEQHGFEVKRNHILETGFQACTGKSENGLKVGIMCEYDALPEIGHACGHNLIAEAAVAAALGLKAILDSHADIGQVFVFGTPAEEEGGGKVIMDKAGCFDNMDICMMVHPAPLSRNTPSAIAATNMEVTFHGKPAHACAFPWKGINALHSAVTLYNSMSVLKQQLKPSWQLHGIITKGGSQVNVITEESQVVYRLWAPTKKELEEFLEMVYSCCDAAAKVTGCTVETKLNSKYANVIHNPTLVNLYGKHLNSFGIETDVTTIGNFSTDMGDVSFRKPSIHPVYKIDTKFPNHHQGFTAAAGSFDAHEETIKAAKAMAMTALDVMCEPSLMSKIKAEFEGSLKAH